MELLREGARSLGLNLSPRHLAAFETYYQELTSWNQRFNLTAIIGYEEVQTKHFLDSLSCLLALPQKDGRQAIPDTVPVQLGAHPLWCIDVGSGAGFPGIPLKIMLPEIKLTLLEATGKKVKFLQHMVQTLGLQNVEVIHGRAEEVAHLPEHRERYDFVVARAVASMCVLAEYCLPFCHAGGRMVALKGEDAEEEAHAAEKAYKLLGGSLTAVKPLLIEGLRPGSHLVVVDKHAPTPAIYPRRPGIPSKRPLC